MIFIVLGAVVAACWHSFVALHGQWTDWNNKGSTHGYLIAAICLWLMWRERRRIDAVMQPFSWCRLWPLAGPMACWLLAVTASMQGVELLLPPLIFWCATGAALGWQAARRALFPIGYFLFAMPLWGAFNGIFQWSSVYAVRAGLRLFGIPAYFSANHVQIPEGTFEIAEGCSGLHFVVVGAAIAVLLGELRRDALARRTKLLVLAVALAMLANWVRVFVIVMAGHLTHMQNYLVARSHYGFGWMVFAAMMAVFFWVESRMAAVPVVEPEPARMLQERAGATWRGMTATIGVLALFAAWRLLAVRPASGDLPEPAPKGWLAGSAAALTWQPRITGVDASRLLVYRREDGAQVEVFTGLYRWQEQDKEFSGYNNDLYPGAELDSQSIQSIGGQPFTVLQFRDAAGREQLVAANYRVGAEPFARPIPAQFAYAVRALLELRSPLTQVLLLHAACKPDCATTLDLLRAWKDQT